MTHSFLTSPNPRNKDCARCGLAKANDVHDSETRRLAKQAAGHIRAANDQIEAARRDVERATGRRIA